MPYIDHYEVDDEQPGWKGLSQILDGIVGLDMPFHELLRARALDLLEEDDATLVLGRTVGVNNAHYGIEIVRLQEPPPHRKLVALLMINQSVDTKEAAPKRVSRRRDRKTKPKKD